MRIREVAAVVFLATGIAAAQEEPDKVGEHKYAGETCQWATHNADRYVAMTYKELVGRISTVKELGSVADAFAWKVMPGPGADNGVIGNSTTGRGALDDLCGALIRAHDRARQQAEYDPDAAFRELLDALEPKP